MRVDWRCGLVLGRTALRCAMPAAPGQAVAPSLLPGFPLHPNCDPPTPPGFHPPHPAPLCADERDEIMTQSLLRLEGRVVGVVGLAHLDGIERRWEEAQGSGRALTAGRAAGA